MFCIVSIISTAISMILFLAIEKRPKLITVWFALSVACLCASFGIALYDEPGFIVGVVGFALAGALVWLVTKFGKHPTPAELKADRTPVRAVLVEAHKSGAKTVLRGLMGYYAFGTAGAIVAVAGAKSKAIFNVTYESGRTGTEIVEVGSGRYNELISLYN